MEVVGVLLCASFGMLAGHGSQTVEGTSFRELPGLVTALYFFFFFLYHGGRV
jgi:hypothetical protein